MNRFASTSAVILVAAMLAPSGSSQGNVGGRYNVEGTNFDGSRYGGSAEITVTSKNTCRIVWVTGGGSSTSTGICMRNGTSFAAGYQLGESIGLVIYEIKKDGTLEGLWTVADQDGVGTETLVPAR
jgi:hypothetical protein